MVPLTIKLFIRITLIILVSLVLLTQQSNRQDLSFEVNQPPNKINEIKLKLLTNYGTRTDLFDYLSFRSDLTSFQRYYLPNCLFTPMTQLLGENSFKYSLSALYLPYAAMGIIINNQNKDNQIKRKSSDNREFIKILIEQNPGITLREVQRKSNLAMGVTQYHIRILEENGEIGNLKQGRSKHFFVSSTYSNKEKLWFSLTRNSNIKDILDIIFSSKLKSQKDLTMITGFSKALISYYIKLLKINGLLDRNVSTLKINDDFSDLFDLKNN